jgi:c-di-GMP-binding flagellar brake protein YcgR
VWFELQAPVSVEAGDSVMVVGVGDDGAAWGLETEVADVRDPGGTGIPIVKVIDTGQWDAVQRREYYRVPATLRVALCLTASPVPERAVGALVAVTTVDLSGGGLQLETDYALMVGDTLELSLELPTRTIRASGMITRVVVRENGPFRALGRDSTRLVGVELGPMMERDRAELVRFVHDVERRLRAARAG